MVLLFSQPIRSNYIGYSFRVGSKTSVDKATFFPVCRGLPNLAGRKKGAQKKGDENSPISPPLDPRLTLCRDSCWLRFLVALKQEPVLVLRFSLNFPKHFHFLVICIKNGRDVTHKALRTSDPAVVGRKINNRTPKTAGN